MAVRERAASHQGGDDGDPGQLGQHRQLAGGAGPDHAAADVQDGALRLEDQPGGLADLLGVRPGHRAVAGQVQLVRPLVRRGGLQRGLRDVDEHRAGAAGGGDVERLGDGARDLGRVGHEEVVLGDRHRDAADVRLLEGVRADRRGSDLAGDRHDRDRVHVRVGERRDQVRGAGPRRRHAHADAAGRRGVPLRGVARALLVADQDVPDGAVHQRVVRREDGATGDPEDVLRARSLQRPDQALRTGDRRARRLAHLLCFLVCPESAQQKTPRPVSATRGDARLGRETQPTRRVRTRISVRMRQPSPPGSSPSSQSVSRPRIQDAGPTSWRPIPIVRDVWVGFQRCSNNPNVSDYPISSAAKPLMVRASAMSREVTPPASWLERVTSTWG